MTHAPFFSIIIPCFNRGDFIAATLSSIIDQTFSNIEIIIVDDGSMDNTEEVVATFSDNRIRYLKIENRERGGARNEGLRYATGQYINYFDSDDLYLPCLTRLSEFIKLKNFPSVVYGTIKQIDNSGLVFKSNVLKHKSFTKNLLFNNFLACGSVFMKREVAVQFLFHEDRRLSSAEDWELWLRVHSCFVFHQFPEPIFQQVHHSSRSLNTISPEKIEIRDSYFAELIANHKGIKNFYGAAAINLFLADRYTFIALAWYDSNSFKAFQFVCKSLTTSFFVVTRKRFWAVMKKLTLNKMSYDEKDS